MGKVIGIPPLNHEAIIPTGAIITKVIGIIPGAHETIIPASAIIAKVIDVAPSIHKSIIPTSTICTKVVGTVILRISVKVVSLFYSIFVVIVVVAFLLNPIYLLICWLIISGWFCRSSRFPTIYWLHRGSRFTTICRSCRLPADWGFRTLCRSFLSTARIRCSTLCWLTRLLLSRTGRTSTACRCTAICLNCLGGRYRGSLIIAGIG